MKKIAILINVLAIIGFSAPTWSQDLMEYNMAVYCKGNMLNAKPLSFIVLTNLYTGVNKVGYFKSIDCYYGCTTSTGSILPRIEKKEVTASSFGENIYFSGTNLVANGCGYCMFGNTRIMPPKGCTINLGPIPN